MKSRILILRAHASDEMAFKATRCRPSSGDQEQKPGRPERVA
jgi:hypothetical protein